jgi:hypothetical protein
VYAHPAAACVTLMVTPATASVPVRSDPGFGATIYRDVPLPFPPLVTTVIHEALDAAVQTQLGAEAVTVICPSPPPVEYEAAVGDTPYWQPGAGGGGFGLDELAAWVTT